MKILLFLAHSSYNPDAIYYLIGAVIAFFILFQLIKIGSGRDKIIENQKETNRLLRKIAGESEIRKNDNTTKNSN